MRSTIEPGLVIDLDRVVEFEVVDSVVDFKVELRVLDDHRAAFDTDIPRLSRARAGVANAVEASASQWPASA